VLPRGRPANARVAGKLVPLPGEQELAPALQAVLRDYKQGFADMFRSYSTRRTEFTGSCHGKYLSMEAWWNFINDCALSQLIAPKDLNAAWLSAATMAGQSHRGVHPQFGVPLDMFGPLLMHCASHIPSASENDVSEEMSEPVRQGAMKAAHEALAKAITYRDVVAALVKADAAGIKKDEADYAEATKVLRELEKKRAYELLEWIFSSLNGQLKQGLQGAFKKANVGDFSNCHAKTDRTCSQRFVRTFLKDWKAKKYLSPGDLYPEKNSYFVY